MKHILKYIIVLLSFTLFASCLEEEMAEPFVGDEVLADIKFSHTDFEQVTVTTKSTLDIVPESRVSNMFVFVFVGEKRYYAHYFSGSDLKASEMAVITSDVNCWYVDQKVSETDEPTHGTLRIKCPEVTGAKLLIMANIDADMVNVSPEKLNAITSYSQLTDLTATMNQEITSRNGLFPMFGSADVDISAAGIVPTGGSGTAKVELERFDAKVKVRVRVATANEISSVDGGVTTKQTLKEFRPESWRVVNLPKGCYIVPRTSDAGAGFFSTESVGFETVGTESFTFVNSDTGVSQTVESTVNGFSFYMMENRQTAKNTVSSYHERDRRIKTASGEFDTSSGLWVNAPEDGTYLEIKGEVLMDVDVSSEAKTQQLAADVTYYVHLGDIATSVNDYNVNRNTFYTYTITIKGVRNIELEVTSSDPSNPSSVEENEPGAEGMVYVAKESIFTFDAHYGQRVFCFDAAYIDPNTVTWYVKTPFGKEGTPPKVGDTEIPSGMDYDWVHFVVNNVSSSNTFDYEYGGSSSKGTLDDFPYSRNNMAWPGDPDDGYESDAETALWASGREVMDIVGFTKYIKEQARAYNAGEPNVFRREFDQDWFDWYNDNHPGNEVSDPATLIDGKPGPWFRDRIYMTVFVDEFYYDQDPITGEKSQTLWKRFVNQPNRLMHILCDNQKSLDKASSATGSVITLRQRSIQTPYSLTSDCATGWGCETEDENADSYFFFYPDETDKSSTNLDTYKGTSLGNNSVYNGLYNTVRLWGCYDSNANLWQNLRWDEYLDYERINDYTADGKYIIFLQEDKACLKYSAMMRNRDNNGNGIIDPEEVKWYTASLGQLEFLFFGELGLAEDAVLYPIKYSSATGTFASGPYAGEKKWKCHVISSTESSNVVPQLLWAEEGLSVGNYKAGWWEAGPYLVKCVRNLGFTPADFASDDDDHRPQNIVDEYHPSGTVDENSVYHFGMLNLNDKSKRFFTSVELEPADENSEMARLYNGLETGAVLKSSDVGINSYSDLYDMLLRGESPCPEGYRVPNIREAALMYLLCSDANWWKGDAYNPFFTCSYYSRGPRGLGESGYYDSWGIQSALKGGNINLSPSYPGKYIRCVRDWNP
ncbi:MAG: hypothetical protein ACI4TM_08210 [Candidatus Cryptobacteroides sp.]